MSLDNFAIIESTLREGEQFANAFFTSDQKLEIAGLLDTFGVEYLELTSPAASPQSEQDCKRIAEQSGRPVKDVLEEALLVYRHRAGQVKKGTGRK